MRIISILCMLTLLASCSSTRMIDSWRSSENQQFKPKNILIVGLTDNLTGRKLFEESLTRELKKRNLSATEALKVFNTSFINLKQDEEQIEKELNRVKNATYDAILITSVKGVDERISYTEPYYSFRPYYFRLRRYYYMYQDIYFDRGYYNRYKIYHLESALYDVSSADEKNLVWVASYDLVDPQSIKDSVEDYVKGIISSLEKENLIPKL